MISRSSNRVQAIKSKFENLNSDTEQLFQRQRSIKTSEHLSKQKQVCQVSFKNECTITSNHNNKENASQNSSISSDQDKKSFEFDSNTESTLRPNSSYLYKENRSLVDKKALTRQSSDPGKKLHRSHAFRCDRTQKVSPSPKRHGSCKGRPETSDYTVKPGEKRLSRDRLRKLGNLLEDQMKKENFVAPPCDCDDSDNISLPYSSIPDENVPQHILEQYAKVIKKKNIEQQIELKIDTMSDSGVSSETENLDDDKCRLLKPKEESSSENDQLEDIPVVSNLCSIDNELSASCRTLKLEKKNPHITLTDTLKKALKQPLPAGPPPRKPPRTFVTSIPESPENNKSPQKKDAKKMLEKLEQVLHEREAKKQVIYDVAETNLSTKPREFHYLCTNIVDITQRTMPTPSITTEVLKKCFNTLNCANKHHSTISLPYSRLPEHSSNRDSFNCCSCTTETVENDKKSLVSTFKNKTEDKVKLSVKKDEPIYDIPFGGSKDDLVKIRGKSVGENAFKRFSEYGLVNSSYVHKVLSKSMEDLRPTAIVEDQKIYDIPCDISPPATPVPEIIAKPKFEFEKVRSNFETGFHNDTEPDKKTRTIRYIDLKRNSKLENKTVFDKPLPKIPKPVLVKIPSESKIMNATDEEFRTAKKSLEKKFATESKRFRKNERNAGALMGLGYAIAKRDRKDQLDVDRENLNRLMNEIYDTVTAACRMDEQKPSKFPTDSDNTSDDSIKLTRSLTEKRKNYVRRISSRAAYLEPKTKERFRHQTSICSYKSDIIDNTYSTFRSWKSFRNSQCNLNKMADTDDKMADGFKMADSFKCDVMDSNDAELSNMSVDEKAGCLDLELPLEARDRGLFNICLLVGLNYMTGQAYVKTVFPSQVKVPPHIENLIFPETISRESTDVKINYEQPAPETQTYSLVLTDEKGERNYGYCRRVLPEGATCCLPLCYCIIGRYRAPGFYYKILKEIESHHGSSEIEITTILQQLFDTDFPYPGEDVTISYTPLNQDISIQSPLIQNCLKSKTLPDHRQPKVQVDNFYDLENNNTKVASVKSVKTKVVTRPLEPRVDEDNFSVLLDTLGAGLLIKVFGSMLLERKVVLISDNLSLLSSCMEALQSILYPFVWQQPLISAIPAELHREILEAPLPILAGALKGEVDYAQDAAFQEGMLIDISNNTAKVLFYQGDESTILPTVSYKTLKTTLQMESSKNQHREKGDGKTRNVMISEAFLRFFVDILSEFWQHFAVGELKDGDLGKKDVVFQKEAFIKSVSWKQHQCFLEWFTETAMFNHFVQNMASCYHARLQVAPQPIDYATIEDIVDAPLPNYYELFEERLTRNSKKSNKTVESNGKTNYKNAVNRKVKLLKSKLRDLVT